MLPAIANLYFTGRLKGHLKPLGGIHTAILLGIGLQRKEFSELEKELTLNNSQLLAAFVKLIRKVTTVFRTIVEGAVEETMPEAMEVETNGADGAAEGADQRFKPLEKDLDEELREGGDEALREERERAKALIDALPLGK